MKNSPPPPEKPNSKERNTGAPKALRAGLVLKSKHTGNSYTVNANLTIFTSDYPYIHPNFIIAHDIRNLMRKGELYIDECATDHPQTSPNSND